MKILHTADWHIGKKLYGNQRFTEHKAFLNWLTEYLENERINGLIVAGDIFDTANPSEQSRTLYTQFLARACKICDWIIITAGNHDSPSVLNGPKELFSLLNIHVVGKKNNSPEDEIIEIKDNKGKTKAYIAAVPYLRDRDLRQSVAGETEKDKEQKLRAGIKAHYDNLADIIIKKQNSSKIPTIAVGHLYAAGCSPENEGDGVRDLYVGGLGHVSAQTFSHTYDYVALGHIHVPQRVNKQNHIRYSGSPIPMGYGEANQQKILIQLEYTEDLSLNIQEIKIPTFQELIRIKGDLENIKQQIKQLITSKSNAWLEIIYTGQKHQGNLRSDILNTVEDSNIEILKIANHTIKQRSLNQTDPQEELKQLTPIEVFKRCLTDHEVAEDEQPALTAAYQQITDLIEKEEIR